MFYWKGEEGRARYTKKSSKIKNLGLKIDLKIQ